MSEGERPFTVLILNPMGEDGWGGVERWFMDLALGLRARGNRVLSVGRPALAHCLGSECALWYTTIWPVKKIVDGVEQPATEANWGCCSIRPRSGDAVEDPAFLAPSEGRG